MTACTIRFTLNGRPVSAEVEPHHNLIELLGQFDLLVCVRIFHKNNHDFVLICLHHVTICWIFCDAIGNMKIL